MVRSGGAKGANCAFGNHGAACDENHRFPVAGCGASRQRSSHDTGKPLRTLGNANITACTAGDANGDSEIGINEIVAGVNNALSGCSD